MKPIKLSMQAFGPFAGTEHLCFADLGQNPLFLINGPTGSGKTTLLDAICLALYNTTTGNERQGAEMRCNQAEPDLETFVEFDFELSGARYRIRRTPEQLRPSKRGEKLVIQRPTARLYRLGEDGSEESGELLVETKVHEANEYIEQLTGLSGDQFRQVMVLPQGEFRKLLLADSRDREDIFASLFHTGIFRKLEEALKNRAAGVRQEVHAQRNQLKGILSNGGVDSLESLEKLVGEQAALVVTATAQAGMATETWSTADKALDAANALDAAFGRLDASNKKAQQLEAQTEDYDEKRAHLALAIEAEKLSPVIKLRDSAAIRKTDALAAKEQARAKLADAEVALEGAVAAMAQAQLSKPVITTARARQLELEGFTAKSDTLARATKLHSSAIEVQQQAHAALDAAIKQEKAARADILKLEAQLIEYQKEAGPLEAYPLQLAKLEPQLVTLRQLGNTAKDLAAAKKALKKAKTSYTAAQEAMIAAKSSRGAAQLAWHRGQAALLATELEEGQPCGVCGSKEHPDPARSGEDLVGQEELELADGDYQTSVSNAQAAQAECDSLMGDIKRLEQALLDYRDSLGGLAEKTVSDIEKEIAALIVGIARLDKLNGDIANLDRDLQDCRLLLTDSAKTVKAADKTAQKSDIELVRAETAKVSAESSLPEEFRAVDALSTALDQVVDEIAVLEKEQGRAQKVHNESTTARALAESALDRAGSDLVKSESEGRQTSSDYAEALGSSPFQTEQESMLAAMDVRDRAQLDQAIANYEAECNDIKVTLKAQKEQVAGKERQDLEALQKAVEVSLTEKKRLDTALSGLSKHLHTLEQVKTNFVTASTAMEELEVNYAVIGTLSDVANGQTGNKVSLQRFVLGVLLDDVLIQATQRLSSMSSGRYQLIRKGEKTKGNKASGLDLMVYDDHSGTERSVATLSGGESFMAALSLALGLSDVVQSYAGGIRLDTLFVDEGFGSLDPESLELAIRTLIDLQKSGRMVGVISHVTELKEQMEVRIDVEKGVKGSHLAIVGPDLVA
ncbi:MAG: hypothetical protein DRR42_11235 [Gammaproteobacteria bacterium]|nr:MAG: hypothetical protein DRR42_11235 [Gammaproteobacteria bacterium]